MSSPCSAPQSDPTTKDGLYGLTNDGIISAIVYPLTAQSNRLMSAVHYVGAVLGLINCRGPHCLALIRPCIDKNGRVQI